MGFISLDFAGNGRTFDLHENVNQVMQYEVWRCHASAFQSVDGRME